MPAETGQLELALFAALALARTDGVDHALERQLAGAGDYGGAGGEGSLHREQAIGLRLQSRPGGARDDAGYAAAVGEVPIRGIDDRVHRLFQEVAPNHLEEMSRRYFFF